MRHIGGVCRMGGALLFIDQGQMQGAATATNAAHRIGSH